MFVLRLHRTHLIYGSVTYEIFVGNETADTHIHILFVAQSKRGIFLFVLLFERVVRDVNSDRYKSATYKTSIPTEKPSVNV